MMCYVSTIFYGRRSLHERQEGKVSMLTPSHRFVSMDWTILLGPSVNQS